MSIIFMIVMIIITVFVLVIITIINIGVYQEHELSKGQHRKED